MRCTICYNPSNSKVCPSCEPLFQLLLKHPVKNAESIDDPSQLELADEFLYTAEVERYSHTEKF